MDTTVLNLPQPVQVVVAFHSGFGHTARVAWAIADGVRRVADASADALEVDELNDAGWSSLDAADAIVFGTPTYMGGSSAAFRYFVERTSSRMARGMQWRDKIAGGFTNSGAMSGDKMNTLTDLAVFAAQHAMIWVGSAQQAGWNCTTSSADDLNRLGSWLGVMTQSDVDASPELAPPPSDLRTARAFGQRIAYHARIRRAGLATVDRGHTDERWSAA